MLTQRPRFPRIPQASIATSLTAGSMALLIAPTTSAIELGLADDMASALGDGMMIQTVREMDAWKIDVFGGGTVEFERVTKTIEFEDGPVAITGFETEGFLDVAVKTVDDEQLRRLVLVDLGDLADPVMVERIQLKSLAMASDDSVLHIDLGHDLGDNVGESAPVPEPGAALLFGAGLAAVASRRK